MGKVTLSAHGAYQIQNALGAAALCQTLGASDADVIQGLSHFAGIPRRMEKRGYLRGNPLYLDFAHHPKELLSALKTASRFGRPLAAVFEPHTYSRTKTFFEEYVRLLRLPHIAGVLPIYAAREKEDPSVSSERLAREAGIDYLPDYAHAASFFVRAAGNGCTLLLVGAGGVEEVLSHLDLEGGKFGLLEHTDIVLAQDVGSKAHCIAEMLKYGYDPEKVLMIGDAPGDCDAAEKNGVQYYPILVNHEKDSWDEAVAVAFDKLQQGEYAPYGMEKKRAFLQNFISSVKN